MERDDGTAAHKENGSMWDWTAANKMQMWMAGDKTDGQRTGKNEGRRKRHTMEGGPWWWPWWLSCSNS